MNIKEVDKDEAPDGFYAVEKPEFEKVGNICRQCDWMKQCQDWKKEYESGNHWCMADKRKDGMSVVFKRK